MILINHYKDPYQTTSISWKVSEFFFFGSAQLDFLGMLTRTWKKKHRLPKTASLLYKSPINFTKEWMLIAQKGIPGAPLWFVFFQGAVPRLRAVPSTNFIPLEPCFFLPSIFSDSRGFFWTKVFWIRIEPSFGNSFWGNCRGERWRNWRVFEQWKKGPLVG